MSTGNVKEVTMRSHVFIHRIGFAAGGVAIAIVLFLTGFWAGSARGGLEDTQAERASGVVPAWFGPIWDYYDRNPAVAPTFDFAGLYAGETPGVEQPDASRESVLSPPGVDHHVSAILRELGARTRGEAAAEAARLGLLQDR